MGLDKLIFWFDEVGREHNDIVGQKSANLGVMTQMGLPVPPGFAISIDAYKRFIEETGVAKEIAGHVSSLGELKDAGVARLEEISWNICSMIEDAPMPASLKAEISSYYEQLCNRVQISEVPVSVRSAGRASRPGMFETYLNVKGKDEVVDKVKKVWGSAFTSRAICFRVNKGMPVDGDMLGVAIPKMINAQAAGIGFTVDPISGDSSKIVIEANWGLGEGVVSGAETVDRFVLDKQSLEIIERAVGKKLKQVVSTEKGAGWEDVPPELQIVPCLGDDEIRQIAKMANMLEEQLGEPQDIEWAIDPDFSFPNNVFLLQTRPAKTAVKKPESASDQLADRIVSGFRQIDLSQAKDRIRGIEFKF